MASPETAIEEEFVPVEERLNFGWIAMVLAVFALLYSVSAGFFSTSSSSVTKVVAASNLYGPIEIRRPNRVIRISVKNTGPRQGWAFVEGEILDVNKKPVLSFGGSYWHESGYDDGHWSERESKKDVLARFPKPGIYFLKFKVEGGNKRERTGKDITASSKLTVGLDYRRGSSIFFNWLAGLLLAGAIILNEKQNRSIRRFFKRGFRAAAKASDEEDDE